MREHRTRTRMLIAALSAAAFSAVSAAGASADVASVHTNFKTKATEGFTLKTKAFQDATLGFTELRLKNAGAYALYRVDDSKLTQKRFAADFGKFGEIDAEFKTKETKRRCIDGNILSVKHRGAWKGKLLFTGEDGYTQVNRNSVPAVLGVTKLTTCGEKGSHPRAAGPTIPTAAAAKLPTLLSCGPGDVFYFRAQLDEAAADPDRAVAYRSIYSKTIGGVFLEKSVKVKGLASGFVADQAAGTATVTPPAPFSGTGTLDKKKLSGDLTVDFPGAADAALTPGKDASLQPRVRNYDPRFDCSGVF